ncbi:probable endonuclease 4 isoform X2 [Engraulis encrasicolus]
MATKKRSERKRKADPDTEPGDEVGGGEKHRPVNEKTHGKGKDKYIGAHVSIAGGIWKAVESSVEMKGRSFALFLGSQRSWQRPALDGAAAVKFQEACKSHGFNPNHILPHGSYLMNCGSPKQGARPCMHNTC